MNFGSEFFISMVSLKGLKHLETFVLDIPKMANLVSARVFRLDGSGSQQRPSVGNDGPGRCAGCSLIREKPFGNPTQGISHIFDQFQSVYHL